MDQKNQNNAANLKKIDFKNVLIASIVSIGLLSVPSSTFAQGLSTQVPESTYEDQKVIDKVDKEDKGYDTVYFGNGCFWGRQKDFIDVELKNLNRQKDRLSAVVGYAGGKQSGPSNKVCYYYGPRDSIYEKLGHAEVVQVNLSQGEKEESFREFAKQYFKQFIKTPFGIIREDPQDMGPGYRNVIGLPGGVSNPLFKILQEENINNMQLKQGGGNQYIMGQPLENDKAGLVYILDSNQLPFYRAEQYHQFHNGIGVPFPDDYTKGLKTTFIQNGKIDETQCE